MTRMSGSQKVDDLSVKTLALLKAETPTIDIVGDVNADMFQSVRAALMCLRTRNNPDVDIVITSRGGDVEAGLDIYDLLRLYPGKKTATVFDKAASMAAIILQACDVRQCARHSSVLIHHISRGNVTLDVLRSKKKLESMISAMESRQKLQYKILSHRTGKTISVIRRACSKDQFMSAQEALDFGLVDSVV